MEMDRLQHVTRSAISLLVALVFLPLTSFSVEAQSNRKRERKTTKPPQPEFIASSLDDPRDGQVVGQTYSNKFFGLTFKFPAGWFVLSEAGNEAIREQAKTKIKQDDQQRHQAMEQALQRTYTLLHARQRLVAEPGQSSASLMCVVEVLPVVNISPSQYLELLKHSLTGMDYKYEIVSDPAPEQLTSGEYALLKLKIDSPAGSLLQEYHVTLRRGFAIGFILTYATDEQRALLIDALNSVNFAKPSR